MVLVFIVMLVFLQNFRATLIPTLVDAGRAASARSSACTRSASPINQLSLFGMVLAIGIVVDDAIVVIENVERIMREEGLSPQAKPRARRWGQITGADHRDHAWCSLAVFVPSAMQTGSVGVIYQQFALTIAISMLFSAFLALGFTPRCARRSCRADAPEAPTSSSAGFNKCPARSHGQRLHRASVDQSTISRAALDDRVRSAGADARLAVCASCRAASCRTKTRAIRSVIVQLPPGATMNRTSECSSISAQRLRQHEKP